MQRKIWWVTMAVLGLMAGSGRTGRAAPPGGTPPSGWTDAALNGEAPAGSTSVSGSGAAAVWTITAGGTDIQNEDFQYAYTMLPGDGGVTARLLSQTGGDPGGWAKTGVMLREKTDADAAMAEVSWASQHNLEGLARGEDGTLVSPSDASGVGRDLSGGPIWLRVQRQGQQYQLLSSDDGKSWRFLDSETVTIPANEPILAGLCACAHNAGGNSTTVTATFDNVSVDNNVIVPPPPFGPVQVTLAPTAVLLTYAGVPNAVGYNIYRRASTDTLDKTVLVNAQPDPYSWFIDDNGGKGLTSGTTYVYQVKAVMKDSSGNLTEGSISDPVLAEPQAPIMVGPAASPVALTSYDIGTQTVGSTMLDNSGVLTISGSGSDIQNISDGMRFVATPMIGDYTITAKVLDKPAPGPNNTQAWIKAGVMIRESLDPGAVMANMFLSSGNGINYEQRRAYRIHDQTVDQNASWGGTTPVADSDVQVPVWLRLTRTGDNIEGGYSTDGTTFTDVDPPNGTYINLSPLTYAGLAVTAHQEGTLGIAQFDASSIKIQ